MKNFLYIFLFSYLIIFSVSCSKEEALEESKEYVYLSFPSNSTKNDDGKIIVEAEVISTDPFKLYSDDLEEIEAVDK